MYAHISFCHQCCNLCIRVGGAHPGPPTFLLGVAHKMAADRMQAFRNNPELQRFLLSDVRTTGKKLGVGSYGSVEELEMNELVCAGKRIHDALVERDNDGVTNIERKYLEECQVMAAIRHPNIVQFLGLCFLEESALPMLVMERLDSNLDELLEGAPGLPLSLKQSLLVDVGRGLLYLHTRNPPVVHRDLSARNVLLTSSLVAKISDLGNARIVDLQPGQLARTLTHLPGATVYMPPEAFHEGSQYGPQLDIFSFGHLTLFTLTQVFPGSLLPHNYPDPQNPDHLSARSEVERRRDYIQPLYGQLGEEHPLVQLVCQCLHNIPARRPTAKDLLQRLQAVKAQIEGPYVKVDMEMVRVLREKNTEIKHLQQQFEEDNRRLQVEATARNLQLLQKDDQLQQQNEQLQQLRQSNQQLQSEVQKLQKENKDLDTTLQEYRKECESLMSDFRESADQLHKTEVDRDKYKNQYETALRALARRAERIKQLEQQRKEATERNECTSFQLKQYMEDFDRERVAREEAVKELRLLVEKMKVEKTKQDGEMHNLRGVIKTLQDDIQTLQQERNHELKVLQTVQRENQALKTQLAITLPECPISS